MNLDFIDLGILAILCVVLGHNYLLSRRVGTLMAALRELGPVIETFSTAVDKAESVAATNRTEAERLERAVAAPAARTKDEHPAFRPQLSAIEQFLSIKRKRSALS